MPKGLTTTAFLVLSLLACQSKREAERARIEREWLRHEQVFVELRERREVSIGDFNEACLFFSRLTNVNIQVDHDPFVDCVATRDSHKALEGLREWYRLNKHRLAWDEKAKTVTIQP